MSGPLAPLRGLATSRFTTSQAWHRAALLWDDRRRRPPVVVYQMGKVGSQAVVAGLRAAIGGPVFHVHHLEPEAVRRAEAVYRGAWHRGRNPDHLWDSEHLLRRLRSGDRAPWEVVSLARDPVARNLSSFFQVAEHVVGLDPLAVEAEVGPDAVVPELTRAFLDRYHDHDVPDRWWDEELHAVLGIDVLAEPFPAAGWSQHRSERASVVVIRLDRLDEVGGEALRALVGRAVPAVPAVNVGEAKGTGALYRRFLREVRLPQRYLDEQYGTRAVHHFFSADERRALRERWDGR